MEQLGFLAWIKTLPVEFFYVTVSAVGGMARYLQKYIEEGKFEWKHLSAYTFMGGFSGLMFGEFGQYIGVSGDALLLMSGIGGVMGYEALKFIESYLTRNLRKK